MQLSDFINQALKFIERGTVDRKSKFRLPILASYNENTINQRIVIARKFDGNENSLIIFTDRDSQKFNELQRNESCSLLFWDAGKKMQVYIQGVAEIMDEDSRVLFWKNLSESQKKDYQIEPPPKTNIQTHNDYQFKDTSDRFCCIKIFFKSMDILVLSNNGHQRAIYDFKSQKQDWVTP